MEDRIYEPIPDDIDPEILELRLKKDRYFLKWKNSEGETVIRRITYSRALFLLNATTIFQTDDFYEQATDVVFHPRNGIILTEMKRHEEKRAAWKAKHSSL